MAASPTLRVERGMLRNGVTHLAACDEVGRGALSGPVTIGVVVISEATKTAPKGVRDSKLLAPEVRTRLAPRVERWALCSAVGHASSDEIDEFGIMAGLRMAGHRALAQLSIVPDAVLLDGNHDYLSPPEQEDLFGGPPLPEIEMPAVSTMIKGDMKCAAVAAASILAKTERDALMRKLHADFPEYGWDENKGYSAPAHIEALSRYGPSEHHRRSWRLPGVDAPADHPLVDLIEM